MVDVRRIESTQNIMLRAPLRPILRIILVPSLDHVQEGRALPSAFGTSIHPPSIARDTTKAPAKADDQHTEYNHIRVTHPSNPHQHLCRRNLIRKLLWSNEAKVVNPWNRRYGSLSFPYSLLLCQRDPCGDVLLTGKKVGSTLYAPMKRSFCAWSSSVVISK